MDDSLPEGLILDESFPFELEVFVDTRPHLRDEGVQSEAYLGFMVLQHLFDWMTPCDDKSLYLSFPERWLNLIEQRMLFRRIKQYCPKMRKVTIYTHSVYIIQITPNQCCHIYVEPKKIKEGDEGQLWSEPKMRVINPDGLTVLGGGSKFK